MDQLPLNRGTFQNAQTPEHNNPVDRWAEAHISLVLHTNINSGVDLSKTSSGLRCCRSDSAPLYAPHAQPRSIDSGAVSGAPRLIALGIEMPNTGGDL